ncbi:secretion system protein E [Prauserella marina]|uniref:Pilus assembly protein, ATPase of CpaF family n=2 Tax=Prauserella marina TaxID=530584 RepID=A0A222VRT1_9PSEU|nr:ATPase, T2SS/T4P/T4SS family [Prauserella marina]ASR36609.1 secretion system protein E [Prauserella marina]PWV74020.1 Flp pilus assembly CpaF family ATPase [Prauserella marina]SDD61063.1 Pilus assembly protein, ATPase of CpaF family [Prauserella marina]
MTLQHNGHPSALPPLRSIAEGRFGSRDVREIRETVAARLERAAADDSAGGIPFTMAEQQARMRAYVADEVAAWVHHRAVSGHEPLPVEDEQRLVRAVAAALSGLGALEELLRRDDVENIHVHGCDTVLLELANGTLERWPHAIADTDQELIDMIAAMFARHGQTSREFNAGRPLGNLRIAAGGPLGARVAAVMEISDRPRLAIRRHRLVNVGLDDLVANDTLDPLLAAFLRSAVRAGCNIIVCGGPAAGKTTLLRALCGEIPASEHVVTVEEEYELGLHIGPRLLVTPLEARPANSEGIGEISMDDLLKQTLRHSPSRVIVGEVRGGEVTAMLRALGNGAAGGMCTVHATTASAVFDRIGALGQLATPPLPIEAAHQWAASAIDLVVHIARSDHQLDGRRRRSRFVSEVLEVGPVGDSGRPDTTRLFAPRQGDGRAVPAYPPSNDLFQRLQPHGFPQWPTGLSDRSLR